MNHLDLFSGIGGFALGIEQAGIKVKWTGFSDIDKYANKLFKRRFPNAEELGSVENVSFKELKGRRIDLLTGGFPCQAFSQAGARLGFADRRGTLFFEIERILKDYIENGKPIPCFLLENVKGLLSHDSGRTFATIYKVLADLNYTLECELLNTKWWLPQSRQRIFIFGRYNGNPSGRKVFPIRCNERKVEKSGESKVMISAAPSREFGWKEISPTLCSRDYKDPKLIRIGELGKGDGSRVFSTKGTASTLKALGGGWGAKTGLYEIEERIRRLTPVECERLQGFPDNWTEGQSDTQRYKQCGNAVSVPVIKAIVERIYDEEL